LVEAVLNGLSSEASPAGEVAGTVRSAIDAIGETYNLLSQPFSTKDTPLARGRIEGAYENMTSLDDVLRRMRVKPGTQEESLIKKEFEKIRKNPKVIPSWLGKIKEWLSRAKSNDK